MFPMAADAMSVVLELLGPLQMEVCMFGLAVVVYMVFSGDFATRGRGRGKSAGKKPAPPASSPSAAAPTPSAAGTRPGTHAPGAAPWGPSAGGKPAAAAAEASAVSAFNRALRQRRLGEALQHFASLPPSALSPGSAAKLLGALARSPVLEEDIMDKLMDLAGRFEARTLEAAAADAQRQGDAQACRQLYQVAGLASIPRTERALELLVRGHGADPAAMRGLVEEMMAPGAGQRLSRGFADALLGLCDAVEKGADAATAPLERGVRGGVGGGDLSKQAKAISAHGKDGHLDMAVRVFEDLRASGTPANALVYNCLLDACVQCEDMEAALKYFAEIKEAGLVDVVTYNTVMKGHLLRGEVAACHLLLEEMTARGVPANRITYHGLLNAAVLRGDRRGMWQLSDKMQAAGLTANAVTCSILLKAVTTPSQAQDLVRVLALMDGGDKPADEVLFASVVEACIRAGCLDLLSERTRTFAQHGGLAKLSAPTYGSMIKAYGQAKDVERIWELWGEMAQRQVTPTAITLGCMVEALVMNYRTEDAWELAQKVWEDESQRASVNTVIYSTILKGFAMAKEHDKVTALYDEMKARGIPRNTITYNTILNSLARCGLMDKVPDLLEDMRVSEPRAEPDIVTYSTIIKGYCMSGDLDKSLALLREMRREANIMPDEVMYNSLLDGCARQQRLEDALALLDEMKEAKVAPSNYTLSILSKLLGRARRLNQAFSMVESVSKEYNFRPNIQVYTCLIQACFHNRQLGRALGLHDQIVREGLAPDEKTYTALARGCLQAGAVDKAVEVVRCAHHLPCQGLRHAARGPQGVEARCLEEVIAALRHVDPAAAGALEADLQAVGGYTYSRPHGGYDRPGAAQRRLGGAGRRA